MIVEQPERIDMEILRDIAADMRGDLDRVQEQMAELTREHNADVFISTILEGPSKWKVRPVAEFFYENEIGQAQTVSGAAEMVVAGDAVVAVDDPGVPGEGRRGASNEEEAAGFGQSGIACPNGVVRHCLVLLG